MRPERGLEIGEVHGLRQVGVESCLLAAMVILGLTVAGQRNQPNSTAENGANSSRHLEAVHRRKADVDDGDIGLRAQRLLDALGAIDGHFDLEAVHFEELAQELPVVFTVLDQENSLGRASFR
jgi:hypothetical protein